MILSEVVAALHAYYGPVAGPPTSDPFELILWENVAYLAPPPRRHEAFAVLKREVGLTPKRILAASDDVLERATAKGIVKAHSAKKLRECADIAIEEFGGDLSSIVGGPADAAKKMLRLFPSIGEPGAEKILLFAGKRPFLAPDSNILRVLERLGFIEADRNYARLYESAREPAHTLGRGIRALQTAHLVLQEHGRRLCKTSAPRCDGCPVKLDCPSARKPAR